MSMRAMTHVWANSEQRGNALLLLLAIADWSGEDGTAWGTYTTLADKVRITEKAVRYLLKDLEASGELEIERGAGKLVPASRGRAAFRTDLFRVVLRAAPQAREPATTPDVGKSFPDLPEPSEVGKTNAEVGKISVEVGKISVAHIRKDPIEPIERTHTPHAREAQAPDTPMHARMPLIARGESLAYDQQQQRAHRGCHPEVCSWRSPTVRTCMPAFLVDEFARKLFGVPPGLAIADVIAWARSDAPPAGHVAPGDTLAHWRNRWDQTRSSSPPRAAGARIEATGRVVEDADATDALLARLTNGEALR